MPADKELLNVLANEADALSRKIEDGEEAINLLKKKLTYLTESQLPEIMTELGLEQIKTIDGLELEKTSKIRCNNSKERSPIIVKWLKDNGYAATVDNELIVPFDIGESSDDVDLVKAALKDCKRAYEHKESVNTNRLNALVTRLLKEGVDVPLDDFGAFPHDKVKIKRTS